MSSKLNIGIIGYGYWGPNLVRNFSSLPDCKVLRVADTRPARLEAARSQFPQIEQATSADELIRDDRIDAVVIATPVATHFALAKQALLTGKHVLLEKPMTSSVTEALELIELAQKRRKLLMVDHTYLYTGAVRKIKSLVSDGALGNLQYFDSTRINLGLFQSDVNVLWDLAPHDISILDHLVAERPVSVQATGTSHTSSKLENIGYLTLNFSSGMIAHFNCSWVSPVKIRHVLIGGDKKMVVFNDLDPEAKVKIYDSGFKVTNDEEKRTALVGYRTGDIFIPKLENTEALQGMARDFARSIIENARPVANAETGLYVVKVLEAAQRSLGERGAEVRLS